MEPQAGKKKSGEKSGKKKSGEEELLVKVTAELEKSGKKRSGEAKEKSGEEEGEGERLPKMVAAALMVATLRAEAVERGVVA